MGGFWHQTDPGDLVEPGLAGRLRAPVSHPPRAQEPHLGGPRVGSELNDFAQRSRPRKSSERPPDFEAVLVVLSVHPWGGGLGALSYISGGPQRSHDSLSQSTPDYLQ